MLLTNALEAPINLNFIIQGKDFNFEGVQLFSIPPILRLCQTD